MIYWYVENNAYMVNTGKHLVYGKTNPKNRLAVVIAQSIEARCLVENIDVVEAVPTGDAPTTS